MPRKRIKLKKTDIGQNSGREISHTIAKIKAHERFYTSILVVIFMAIMVVCAYFAFRIDPNKITLEEDIIETDEFTYTSNLVFLTEKNNGKKNGTDYVVNVTNNTDENKNYVIKLNLNDEFIENCNCSDSLATKDQIRYSINNGIERTIDNKDMILSTGFIKKNKENKVNVRIWLDKIPKKKEIYFYGKIDIEPIEDTQMK